MPRSAAILDAGIGLNSRPGPTIFRIEILGSRVGERAHNHLVFETAIYFLPSPGIRWASRVSGAERSPQAAQRILLRRMPDVEFGEPTPEVVEAIAAVKRYFEGKETDFSGFKLDLSDQDSFFKQLYVAARHVRWVTRRPTGRWRRKSVPGERPRVMSAKPWPRSGGADHPMPQGLGGRRQDWWFFRARRLGG